jgi:hypothetical protein
MTDDELLEALDRLKATMIAVATGGPRIDKFQHEFAKLYDAVQYELARRDLKNPIPYRDLWEWYGRWSSGDMPSWQSRRSFVNAVFADLVQAVEQTNRHLQDAPLQHPTGWARVDRSVTEVRKRLETAGTEEQFQSCWLTMPGNTDFARAGCIRSGGAPDAGRSACEQHGHETNARSVHQQCFRGQRERIHPKTCARRVRPSCTPATSKNRLFPRGCSLR